MPLSGGVRRIRRSANGSAGDAKPPRQLARDQRRLVEAAPPQPRRGAAAPARAARSLAVADQRRHVARHGPRDRDLAPIFQADREAARQIAIGDRGPRPGDPRRPARGRRRRSSARSPASGMPQVAQPPSPRNSTCFQQSGQKLWTSATIVAAAGAARRKREIERPARAVPEQRRRPCRACRSRARQRTSAAMRRPVRHGAARAAPRPRRAHRARAVPLRARVRRLPRADRAHRSGRFERALLIGCPDPGWPARLGAVADGRRARSGPLFAEAAGGDVIVEDDWLPTPRRLRPRPRGRHARHGQRPAARAARCIRARDAPTTLCSSARCPAATRCRSCAPRCAPPTRSRGAAAPHVHPRIEAAALAPLLERRGLRRPGGRRRPGAGLLSHRSTGWSRDLRAMGATNILAQRPRFARQGRAAAAAERRFRRRPATAATVETFEILHFAAWTPRAKDERAVNSVRGRVVNPATAKPAAWTWTRGGWRERYPKEFAQAARRQARRDCDRIWLDRRADRRCDDGGLAVAWRRRRRHVDASSTTQFRTATC